MPVSNPCLHTKRLPKLSITTATLERREYSTLTRLSQRCDINKIWCQKNCFPRSNAKVKSNNCSISTGRGIPMTDLDTRSHTTSQRTTAMVVRCTTPTAMDQHIPLGGQSSCRYANTIVFIFSHHKRWLVS